MMVHSNFDAKNLLLICLRISSQIFAIVPNFPNNFFRDQHFCTPLCEFGQLVMVLFTGLALEVEVPPGMVCCLICIKGKILFGLNIFQFVDAFLHICPDHHCHCIYCFPINIQYKGRPWLCVQRMFCAHYLAGAKLA